MSAASGDLAMSACNHNPMYVIISHEQLVKKRRSKKQMYKPGETEQHHPKPSEGTWCWHEVEQARKPHSAQVAF
jgi:subtilisin-like proprotein convertase family protein